MTEVGVHLADPVVSVVERPPEPGSIRRAQTLPAVALDDVDPRHRCAELMDPRPRAVGRTIIDEEQIDRGRRTDGGHPVDERVDVLDLVIGRHNHDQLCMFRSQPMSLPYAHQRTAGGFIGQIHWGPVRTSMPHHVPFPASPTTATEAFIPRQN